MHKGTTLLVPFPFTDLTGTKIRPCVLLYDQKSGEDCIVAFISSEKHKRLSATDIQLKSTAENGLKVDSVLKIDKVATLQKKIILGELGVLDATVMKKVDLHLKKIFSL